MKISDEVRESVTLINENQKIFSIFHLPKSDGNQKFPAILMCHGFAGQKTGKYRIYVALAEELAKNGMAVLRFDFRGCGDSEGDFLNTTLNSQVSDALKGIEFLSQHLKVDPKRIGVFGRSLGGAIAVISAKKQPLVKSLALWVPLFSAESWKNKWEFLKRSGMSQDQIQKVMMINGQLPGDGFLKQLFELRLEEDLSCLDNIPLLHVHCEKDTVVNSDHTERYKQFRSNAKSCTEYLSLPNSDHDFTDIDDRNNAIHKTVDWFKKTL